ncbi:hypothetical protein MKW98_025189 [Papaver atlanticum]|uniref:Uncharacterized protein n=1 Tax=Papaver atlanticum TaxID=357466 RepID=A0AAD4X6B9_9MAGN|nr:hypothetical protein MKW98_025189 [Papaver atlanticum]
MRTLFLHNNLYFYYDHILKYQNRRILSRDINSPFQLVTVFGWKETAFGGLKSHCQLPRLVENYMKKTCKKMVQEEALTALASISDQSLVMYSDSYVILCFTCGICLCLKLYVYL